MLKGGVPGVRQAVDRMNEKAAAEGMPKIKTEPLVALAEKLAPSLKAAEWRDRAEAALAGIDDIDIKDIRSVVVAADTGARNEESRALADQLRTVSPLVSMPNTASGSTNSRRTSRRAARYGPCVTAHGRRRPVRRCRPTWPNGSRLRPRRRSRARSRRIAGPPCSMPSRSPR